jgi:hypothetical protein
MIPVWTAPAVVMLDEATACRRETVRDNAQWVLDMAAHAEDMAPHEAARLADDLRAYVRATPEIFDNAGLVEFICDYVAWIFGRRAAGLPALPAPSRARLVQLADEDGVE